MKRTVKIVALFATLIIAIFTLTGCMNINFEVKLDKNGSGDVSYIWGYNKSVLKENGMSVEDLKNQGDTSLDELKETAEKDGYKVEEYEDENTYGIKATKHFEDIGKFSLNEGLGLVKEGSKEAANDKISFEKNDSKIKYSQDAKIDLTTISAAEMGLENEEETDASQLALMNAIIEKMKFTYKVTLPIKAGENNATTVSKDGKTLEWEFTNGKENEVKFVAEEKGGFNILYLVVALAVIAVIATIIAILAKKSKNTSGTTYKEEVKGEEPIKEENPIKEDKAEENNEE